MSFPSVMLCVQITKSLQMGAEILYADCKLSEAVSLDNVLSGNAFQLLTQGGTGRAAVRVENQHGMPTRAH
ncbi:hypothetical protein V6N12_031265 [Hibiscus sabdariffa]|uniref:Uncharacterized protein n=1 Tax=Hibiscus sabdariffa TaxID=183260 RepID=A0ABR2E8Y9_9ROSI